MPARNLTHQSESLRYEQQIRQWFKDDVCGATIHQALKDQFGFDGSYSSVRPMPEKLRATQPEPTCILDFAPRRGGASGFQQMPRPYRRRQRRSDQDLYFRNEIPRQETIS